MQYACSVCARSSDQPRCPRHRLDGHSHRSPNRDRRKQAAFREAVLARDGHRCTEIDKDTGKRCTARTDLRACHLKPLRDFAVTDPAAYATENGVTRCGRHDRETDSYAR